MLLLVMFDSIKNKNNELYESCVTEHIIQLQY